MSDLKSVFDLGFKKFQEGKIGSDELTAYFSGAVNAMTAIGYRADLGLLSDYFGIDSGLDMQLADFGIKQSEVKTEGNANYTFKYQGKHVAIVRDYEHNLKAEKVSFYVNGKHFERTARRDDMADIEEQGYFFAFLDAYISNRAISPICITGDDLRNHLNECVTTTKAMANDGNSDLLVY